MDFHSVVQCFSAIEQESSRLKKTELLSNLLTKATPHEAAIIAYLSLGSLQPVYHTEQFNFAEKSLLRVVVTLVQEDESIIKQAVTKMGDLGDVVAQYHRKIPSELLSISQVNTALFDFLAITGIGSQERKEQALYELFLLLDGLCVKYVIRIILGKLRLGFSDMTLLDAFSWMMHGDKSIRGVLEEAYNVCADIGFLVKKLKEDGVDGVKHISITPGIPIRPSAAERLESAEAIVNKLGSCVAQQKLDGFRLQVHIDNRGNEPKVSFFSRNLHDMTNMFPDLREAVLAFKAETLILEGEAIAYDVETDTFFPFQETVKRKRKHDIQSVMQDFPLRLYVFDLLFLNGKSCLSLPHEKRREKIDVLCDNDVLKKQHIVFPIEEKPIKTPNELETYFKWAIEKGLEGLVVKRVDALYQAGKRNFNWIKLKRQNNGELDDSLDCVILGYFTGKGKRSGFGVGAVLVGVYNQVDDTFETIAKLGTGFSDKDLIDLKKTLDAIKVVNKPINVVCAKELFPEVWVNPEIVCSVLADEITQSPLHAAGKTENEDGFALRFPRFMMYRDDKSATDATTVKEVKSLYDLQFKMKKKIAQKSQNGESVDFEETLKEKNLKMF